MKVLFFQRFFAHYQWGLVKELSERGEHEYHFRGDSRDPANTGIAAIPAKRLGQVSFQRARTWQIGQRIAIQPEAIRAAMHETYDVLILEGSVAHPTAWAAMRAAQHRGRRVLLYSHGWTRSSDSPWREKIRTRFMASADALLLYGERARRIGLARGVPPEQMHVVFNCLDYELTEACRSHISARDTAECRSELFADRNLPIVAYVGRVREQKGLGLVLGALARLKARGVNAGFLVVGGGSGIADLKAISLRLGIPSHYTGPVYEEERLAVMLSAARVVVAPKAAGLTVVHAMSYGTPVVTHSDLDRQGPEAEAVIPGQTGELFRPGDEADFADKLTRFLQPAFPRERWAESCMGLVDRYYNPRFMRQVFDRAVQGLPAEDPPAFHEKHHAAAVVSMAAGCGQVTL